MTKEKIDLKGIDTEAFAVELKRTQENLFRFLEMNQTNAAVMILALQNLIVGIVKADAESNEEATEVFKELFEYSKDMIKRI